MSEKLLSGSSPCFFLGANTPKGFYSLFSELYSPEDGWVLYIIKGGPGTGKSSLMKKAAERAEKKGLYCERIYCSSDPDSLDAVIIPSLKVSIADGTSPHVLEPKYPGVSEVIIDLGQYRNDTLLREKRCEIIAKSKENSAEHRKCVDFLEAVKGVDNDIKKIAISAVNTHKTERFLRHLEEKEIPVSSDRDGRMKKRFLSALTPMGFTLFYDTVSTLSEKIWVFEDDFSAVSSLLLKYLTSAALNNGHDCIVCPCVMCPDTKIEHLLIPSLGTAFFSANRFHPWENNKCRTVNCRRFYSEDILKDHRARLLFDKKAKDELLDEAVSHLGKAKAIHDDLEKYYIEAMDFEKMNKDTEALINKIIS